MTMKTKPAVRAEVVTPSDTALIQATRGVLIESQADLAVQMAEDSTSVVLKGLAAGVVHPLSVVKVLATGTGAVGQVTVFR